LRRDGGWAAESLTAGTSNLELESIGLTLDLGRIYRATGLARG